MKYFTLFFLFVCISNALSQQGSLNYTIRIVDTDLKPMSNTPVTLIETVTKERIAKKTDIAGKVNFELTSGEEWSVSILDMIDCEFIEIPKNKKSTASISLTYDYERYLRKRRPLVDRSTLKLEIINQQALKSKTPSMTEAIILVALNKEDKSPLINYPVNLTCYKTGKTYLGKSNATGTATFKVPIKNDYEIDIDGIESFEYIDIDGPGEYTLECLYQPTNVQETNCNDTITQIIPKGTKGTSARIFLTLNVNQSGKKLANEDVYLQMLKTNKVYKAKTNEEGVAYFMLPLKRKYMVHFRYEKDVDVLNYSDIQGIGSAEATFSYHPDPKLQFPERYIPTPEDLMAKDFLEFITKQFPEPPSNQDIGMTLSWGNEQVNKNSKEAILEIGFKAKNASKQVNGPPLNLSLVIDKSGSMAGHDRIDALKEALLNYIAVLRPVDIVSLVVFSDASQVIFPAQPIGDKTYIKDMITHISAGGGTNIYVGMVDGYEQLLKNYKPKGSNKLILLTDGYGSTPPEEMVKKSKEYNSKGLEITTVGVGNGYNQAMLSLLASEGGGLVHFAGTAEEIKKTFEKEILSVTNPIAKSATIEVTYNEKLIFKQLYGHKFTDDKDQHVTMSLNNIYSGLNTLALVKFELNAPTKSIEKKPVIVKMTYTDIKTNLPVTVEEKSYLHWTESTENLDLILEAQHKKLYAIAIINQALKNMGEAFMKQDYLTTKQVVENTITQIKQLYPTAEDADIDKLIQSLQTYIISLNQVIKLKKG